MYRRSLDDDKEKDENDVEYSYEELVQLSHPNPTIVTQQMDGEIARWLLFSNLKKFQWFFNGLSYNEIVCLDEKNIGKCIEKVNKRSIKNSDRKKICFITKNLRARPHKMKFLMVNLDDGESTVVHLSELVTTMRDILECPIPNKFCVPSVQLQHDIVIVMGKLLYRLLNEFGVTNYLIASSFLGYSIKLYIECTALIIHNQSYMRHHVEKTITFANILKKRVNKIERDFF